MHTTLTQASSYGTSLQNTTQDTSQEYQIFKTILTSVCHTILTPQINQDRAMTQILTEGLVDTLLYNNPEWWSQTP